MRPLLFSSCLFGTYQLAKQQTRERGLTDLQSTMLGASATVLPVAIIAAPLDLLRITQQQHRLSAAAALSRITRVCGRGHLRGLWAGFGC